MSDPRGVDPKAEAQRRIAEMKEPRKGQVYKHWKGGYYSIVSVSIKEDTLEELVTYTSNLKGGDTTRTLKDFLEEVEWPGGGVWPRFRREDA